MMNRPSEYDIRSRALEMAVTAAYAHIPSPTPGLLIQNAKAFATYLRDGVDADVQAYEAEMRTHPTILAAVEVPLESDPEPRDVGHPADLWGLPCVECTHSSGLHTVREGCGVKTCHCPLNANESLEQLNATRTVCTECAQGLHPHVFAPCTRSGCACEAWSKTKIPGETTPQCRCGHGRSLHTGESQHCVALINDGQGCVCRGYEP